MSSHLRGLRMTGSPERGSSQSYLCYMESLTLFCEKELLWDFCNRQHNKIDKSSSLCMGFPCCFCWHHINIDKHLRWAEHEWSVPDLPFWSWVLILKSWSSQRPFSENASVSNLLHKRGGKDPFDFAIFLMVYQLCLLGNFLLDGFFFHVLALLYLKFGGENQSVLFRLSHYWWMIIKTVATSGWDYTAETTRYFGLV